MPKTRRPAPGGADIARRILLSGFERSAKLPELLGEAEPLHPRNDTFPGEIFLSLAADAVAWCGPAVRSLSPWKD